MVRLRLLALAGLQGCIEQFLFNETSGMAAPCGEATFTKQRCAQHWNLKLSSPNQKGCFVKIVAAMRFSSKLGTKAAAAGENTLYWLVP